MPIDDERRRLGRSKIAPDTKPQGVVATEGGGSGSKDGVRGSLQTLQEMLLLQQSERAGFRAEEEKRIEANREVMQHARNERNEKYQRLRQAFERMNRSKDEEKAEAAREESKRRQGTKSLSYLNKDLTNG